MLVSNGELVVQRVLRSKRIKRHPLIDDETELTTKDASDEENEAETNTPTDSGILSMVDSENMDHMDVDNQDNQEPYAILSTLLIFH
jgi:hypothetical protein